MSCVYPTCPAPSVDAGPSAPLRALPDTGSDLLVQLAVVGFVLVVIGLLLLLAYIGRRRQPAVADQTEASRAWAHDQRVNAPKNDETITLEANGGGGEPRVIRVSDDYLAKRELGYTDWQIQQQAGRRAP